MYNPIGFLPTNKRTDINYIVGLVKGLMKEAGMVILFGSYARNEHVDFDRRTDFGESKTYQSDYDILILSHNVPNNDLEAKISAIRNKYYATKEKEEARLKKEGKEIHVTPLRILHKDIEDFNNEISDNKYFSVQLKNEGIIIYDKGIYKLAEPRALNYKEIEDLAKEHFYFRKNEIENHLRASLLLFKDNIKNLSAYHLQQVMEQVYHSILLVFTLDSPKSHKLNELNKLVYSYTPEVSESFGSPKDDAYTKVCFELIDKAYIEGRYNRNYYISNEQLIYSMEMINKAVELANTANLKQIEKYNELYLKEKN